MAQIPIFTPNQRIDAGNPVPIGSSEAARAPGEAIAQLGGAMTKLGDMLDGAAKKADAEAAKLQASIALSQYRDAAFRIKARNASAGIQAGDTPDGLSAVDRFQKELDKEQEKILGSLDSDTAKALFISSSSDDRLKESTLVLAGEVKKREELVPLLMQDNINGKGALIRAEYNENKANELMAEAEHDILQNSSIQEKDKLKMIAEAKKHIAKEAIAGFIDRAENSNDLSEFKKAKDILTKTDKFNRLFDSKEMEKLVDNVNQAYNAKVNRDYQVFTRAEALDKIQRSEADRMAVSSYTAALNTAGNNQNKINVINQKIALDPRLSMESKKALLSTNIFKEVKDDTYELNIYKKMADNRNFNDLINQVHEDWQNGKISSDRAKSIELELYKQRDYFSRNPTIRSLVAEGQKRFKTSGALVYNEKTGELEMQATNNTDKAESLYNKKIQILRDNNELTPETEYKAYQESVAEAQIGSKVPATRTLNDIKKEKQALAEEYARGAMSEDRKREVLKLMSNLNVEANKISEGGK